MQPQSKLEIDKTVLSSLYRPTVWPWLKDVILDWAIIFCMMGITYAYSNPITWLLALLVIGNRQHALTVLGHDGTHYTLSYNKKFNDLLTTVLAFWPIGLTVSGYRRLHLLHHQNTGMENDPELAHKKARSPQWNLPAKPMKIFKYIVYDLFGYSFPDYMIILKFSKPATNSEYFPLICFHLIAITAFAASGLWAAGLLWYGGLITTFMMAFRIRLWLEHQGTPDTHRLHLNAWQGALFAPHKVWMHWEHHKVPAVPYHRLMQLRSHLAKQPIMTLSELLIWFQTRDHMSSGQVIDAELPT